MQFSIFALTSILAVLQTVSAHGSINQPRPILFDANRNTYNAPLSPDFANFPCKGYHNQPFNAAETWKAGQEASFTVDTTFIAAHGGGSCQASISHDGGETFQVLHSFIGDCPRSANGNSASGDQVFKFMIPQDEPAGDAIFAWTWFAAIANREMYMDCAFVTIENSNPAPQPISRPNMFVGFLAPGACSTAESTNLDFPEPGDFVTDGSQNPTAQYKGKTKPSGSGCGNAASGGGEQILNSLPPNSDLASGGGNSGPIGGPKPGPGAPKPAETSSSMAVEEPTSTEAVAVPTTVVTSVAVPPVEEPSRNPNVVYVTRTVVNPVVAVVHVTQTVYVDESAPTAPAVKRSEPIVSRSEGCQFQEVLKVGEACPVPSTQSSQWKPCIWSQFCGCLNDNLSPSDIVNFSQVKSHCDCVTKGIGCPVIPRTRLRKKHVHLRAVDMILPRDSNVVQAYGA